MSFIPAIHVLQYINNHQQEFINFINDPEGTGSGGDVQGQGAAPPPGMTYIRVTPEEQADIEQVS